MLASGETLEFRVFDRPSMTLASQANGIGHEAWSARFKDRTAEEIRHVFDPANPVRVYESMKRAAKVGRFVGVMAVVYDDEFAASAGVIWGADDISGNIAQRFVKRRLGRQPYAWIAQSNVRPQYQGQHIGAAMTGAFLSHFDEDQPTTAYVFDENSQTLGWYRDYLGYRPRPAEPVERSYFGKGARPVQQWRLEAAVADVQDSIRAVALGGLVDESVTMPAK